MNDISNFTLLPERFMEQEKCELHSLNNPVFLPDGREFLTWEKPLEFSNTYHVAANHSTASDTNPGTEELPWKTLGKAAKELMPGERVVIHEGIYRELVEPERGGTGPDAMISYEGAEGENVILRGSELFSEDFVRDGLIWKMILPESVASRPGNPFALINYKACPWEGESKMFSDEEINANERLKKKNIPNTVLRQGLIFQDGQRLEQVLNQQDLNSKDGTYWVESDGKTVQLRPLGDIDPKSAAFEYTTRSQVFSPKRDGLGFIRVKNLTAEFTCGGIPFPQYGAVSARKGHHWIFEDNIIRDCNSIGLDVGHRQIPRNPRNFQMHPGGLGQIVRRNRIERCGVCGIVGLGIIQGTVEDNVCLDMGWLNVRRVCESAGIKIHYSHHTIVRGNLVCRTIDAPGIWIDHSNHNVRCFENVIYGVSVENQDGWGGGIFFEASRYHNLVDHNIVWNCYTHGIYQHDCERLVLANNLVGNCSSHPFKMLFSPYRIVHDHPMTGLFNRVYGNIFYASKRMPLLANNENRSDSNLYVEPSEEKLSVFHDWQNSSGQDAHSSSACVVFEFCPETWTLKLSPVPKLPNVARQKAVTFDFFGTPNVTAEIPCGPFARGNYKSVINLKNPKWPLNGLEHNAQ